MAKALPFLQSVALIFAAYPLSAQTPATSEPAPGLANGYPTGPTSASPTANPGTPASSAVPSSATTPTAPTFPPSTAPAPLAPPPAAPAPLTPAPSTAPPPPARPAPATTDPAGTGGITEPPTPTEPAESAPSKWPAFSLRVDPLNWLIEGRLGFEFEVEAWKFLSVETIPLFVVDEQPPYLNLEGIDDTLHQKSNGLGALAGASLGVGFWLNGEPHRGTVLRLYYTNYGYKYEARDNNGRFDQVKHTERRLVGMLGSHSRWGAFTLASGIGLGVEMNREKRCFDEATGVATTQGCDDELLIQVERDSGRLANVTGPFHPVYLLARLSLGFVY